jgi:glutamate dehydrogenase
VQDGELADTVQVRLTTRPLIADQPSGATETSTHTVVDITVDDATFVADSVVAHLGQLGIEVHGTTETTVVGGVDLRIEIDRETDLGALTRLKAGIADVVADVRASVADWQAMRDLVLDRARELRDVPPPSIAAADLDEAVAFFEWLVADHVTFVGAREYRIVGTGADARLEPVLDTALGVARRRPLPDPGAVGATLHQAYVLALTKAGAASTVHRAAQLDEVRIRRFDDRGMAIGEWRIVGLYTAQVYSDSVTRIPVVRRKVATIVADTPTGLAAHDERALANVLETLPREEVFRLPVEELAELARGVAAVGERRRVRLFASPDEFGRFVSCLVYLPRDRYTTRVRTAIVDALTAAFGATSSDLSVLVGESVMARLHVVLGLPLPERDGTSTVASRSTPDVEVLEAGLVDITRAWVDDLRDALQAVRGEEAGLDAFRRWGAAFPPAYQGDVAPEDAAADLAVLESLDPEGDLQIRLNRDGTGMGVARLELYRSGTPLVLSDVMPVLDQLDVVVIDERPYEIVPMGAPSACWIYSFGIRAVSGDPLDVPQLRERVAELFLGVWSGDIENDALNRLVIAAGLTPREVVTVRALTKYLHQAGVRFTEITLATALVGNPSVTRRVVELFGARLDPGSTLDAALVEAELVAEIDAVVSLDDDRILRALTAVARAVVRTNAFLPDRALGDRLAVKLDPTSLDFLPRPRPVHEIWVYCPRVEGVHLRGGDVARGGIRWSDRRDDFRTEVLGLMKAQTAKNAVIVPVGAKGGFVVKRPPADRAALAAEVLECYQTFIRALLDLTDNLVDGEVVHPATGHADGDDPYLVVAADKGTASFSDVANELAAECGYWLGDAFASGGSHGYDHKAMAITARGAWISVRAHFRAMDIDADTAPLTGVGIGDMSGDVFGNGMLRSPHLRLVAAFDHRHVFLDPDPDPTRSFAERQRLFDLTGSSWADYDPAVLSPGGGVYPRSAKSLSLTPEARMVLGLDRATEPDDAPMTPDDVVSAILRAPVDLLWNGGIGTFVKATAESDTDVGDRMNDPVRVDASTLRCRVVGEGGNLGLTQAARVEFALAGGRVYSDAIDNSGGVDCSDHEVNIKILLQDAIRAGRLADGDRDALLVSVTDEVAELVLADNEAQANALEIASVEAASLVGVHARQMERLERAGVLDRALERLPDAKGLQERVAAERGLTAPELAVLLAFTKLELQDALVAADLPDDPYFLADLLDYFPNTIAERYADLIPAHRLAREIIATVVANAVVNRAGISFLSRLCDETGCPLPVVASAHVIARDVYDVPSMWAEIDALDLTVRAATQDRLFLIVRRLVERAARWFARRGDLAPVGPVVERFRAPVAQVVASIPGLLGDHARAAFDAVRDELVAERVPVELASRLAGTEWALGALEVALVASEVGVAVEHAAAVHFLVGDRLQLDRLRARVAALPRADRWQTEARAALRDDVSDGHEALTEAVLRAGGGGGDVAASVDAWIADRADEVARYDRVVDEIEGGGVYDLAQLTAARRALRELSGGG